MSLNSEEAQGRPMQIAAGMLRLLTATAIAFGQFAGQMQIALQDRWIEYRVRRADSHQQHVEA